MKLKGMGALVTGGAMGIGLSAAKRLMDEGCRVVLWDIDAKALSEAETFLKSNCADGKLSTYVCNVSDRKQVEKTASRVQEETGKIDILVNNAGYVRGGGFLDHEIHEWEKTVDVNLNGIIYCTRAFLPVMYDDNFGVVVNVSSASALLGVPDLAVYASTKWAVWGFTESMRLESKKKGKKGVRWSSIHPGYIREGMFEGARLGRFGNIAAPLVKDHDVIAKAIVEKAVKRGSYSPKRPCTLNLLILLRGLLPDRFFQMLIPLFGVSSSMDSWRGRMR